MPDSKQDILQKNDAPTANAHHSPQGKCLQLCHHKAYRKKHPHNTSSQGDHQQLSGASQMLLPVQQLRKWPQFGAGASVPHRISPPFQPLCKQGGAWAAKADATQPLHNMYSTLYTCTRPTDTCTGHEIPPKPHCPRSRGIKHIPPLMLPIQTINLR